MINPAETEKGHLERTTERATDSSVQVPNQLNQHPKSGSMVATTHLKLVDQLNDYICGASFSKDPPIFSVCSSSPAPAPSETKDLKNFLLQGSWSSEANSIPGKQISQAFSLTTPPQSKDGGNADSNDLSAENSGNGSNSVHSQESHDMKNCQDDKTSMHVKNTPGFGDGYSKVGHSSHGRGEATESKLEEPPLTEDGAKTSFSSAISEVKHVDNCSNGDPTTITNSNKHLERSTGEDLKDKSTLEIVKESIAAEILLSFAPSVPRADDHKLPGAKIETEPGRSSRGNMSSEKKWNLRERKYTNYSSNGGMNESMRWTKSFRRTRTNRKAR